MKIILRSGFITMYIYAPKYGPDKIGSLNHPIFEKSTGLLSHGYDTLLARILWGK